MQNKISSEVIADSISPSGSRITTLKVVMPRIILAEFNTHRAFSRNSASSRAIPFKKMLQSVDVNPFIPIAWMKEHKGMQGTEYYTDEYIIKELESMWTDAKDSAVHMAETISNEGVTKQLCNRLLEPFMYHTVLITATEFDNFFELRDHEAAEIHIQALARTMKESMSLSVPKELAVGEWHMPYGDNIDTSDLITSLELSEVFLQNKLSYSKIQELKLNISTARCARISYETLGNEPKIDYKADLRLYNTLLESKHFSPFEHCAVVQEDNKLYKNFKGWKQFRGVLEE